MSRQNDIWQRKPAGLVLGLDFSGQRVTTPAGQSGTLVGNAAVTAGTRYLSLDGVGDYLTFPDEPGISFTSGGGVDLPFSACAWVYLASNTVGNHTVMAKATGSPLTTEWILRTSNGGTNDPSFLLLNSGATALIGRRTGAVLSTGTWHHITGTYSASKTTAGVRVYVNSVQSDTANLVAGTYAGMSDTAALLRVGGTDTGEFVDGRVADVRLYNRVLTASEITQIFNAGQARISQGGTP